MLPEDVVFSSDAVLLAGTLLAPADLNDSPIVILLPGSGHHDRDETLGAHRPFRQIAEFLAVNGVATLRFDGRGVGQSGGTTDAVDFDSKVTDALAAYRFLIEQRRASAAALRFLGHSEGGLVGAAASAITHAPLAMLATPAQPIVTILHQMAKLQSEAMGATDAQVAHEHAMNIRVFAKLIAPGPPDRDALIGDIRAALRTWPDLAEAVADADESAALMADIVLARDFHTLLQQDPSACFAAVRAPLLALYGALDQQVPAAENQSALLAATTSNPTVSTQIMPGHNHLFQVAQTGNILEYETLGQSPSDATLAALITWLTRL